MCAIIMPCYCDSGSDCSKLISFHYIEALPILAVFPVNETGLQIKLLFFSEHLTETNESPSIRSLS